MGYEPELETDGELTDNEAADAGFVDEEAAGIDSTREQFRDSYAVGTADGEAYRPEEEDRTS